MMARNEVDRKLMLKRINGNKGRCPLGTPIVIRAVPLRNPHMIGDMLHMIRGGALYK